MKTIAIYHNKGGVGKTTTVVNLAAALSKKGKKVLIIDLDSQANTTFVTGLMNFTDEIFDNIKPSNILQVIQSQELFSIEEVARSTNYTSPSVAVIPAHIDLMESENELINLEYSRLNLLSKLEAVEDQYEIVLIDTPPSLNLYARVALISANYLIIPSDLKPFANQGLINVKNFINKTNGFRKQIRMEPIEVLGVLASKVSTNSKFGQSTLKNRLNLIEERYQFPLFETVIYEREDLAKCTEKTLCIGELDIPDPRSVLDYKPDSPSAQEFQLLAIEVLKKIGMS